MLCILTGGRQVGKTRLLEQLLLDAEKLGITCKGVITPGIWEQTSDGELAKIGIDALLLPDGERFCFGMKRGTTSGSRSSSAPGKTSCQGGSSTQEKSTIQEKPSTQDKRTTQANSVNLGWLIEDAAIERVNNHFNAIAEEGLNPGDLLVIDELGTLELVHDKGFTSAMALLDAPSWQRGHTPTDQRLDTQSEQAEQHEHAFANKRFDAPKPTANTTEAFAIVIIRPELMDIAKERFTPIWGEPLVIDASSADAYLGIESLMRSVSSASESS